MRQNILVTAHYAPEKEVETLVRRGGLGKSQRILCRDMKVGIDKAIAITPSGFRLTAVEFDYVALASDVDDDTAVVEQASRAQVSGL